MKKKFVIVTASSGKNLNLSQEILKIAQDMGAQGEILEIIPLNLPLYTPEWDEREAPSLVSDVAQKLLKADFHIYVAPEYNGSFPPTFNNFLCWVSRSSKDWREAFNGKSALIATHSGGGGAHVLMAMRAQLSFIGMNVLGRQLLTNYNKALNSDSARECLKMLLN